MIEFQDPVGRRGWGAVGFPSVIALAWWWSVPLHCPQPLSQLFFLSWAQAFPCPVESQTRS